MKKVDYVKIVSSILSRKLNLKEMLCTMENQKVNLSTYFLEKDLEPVNDNALDIMQKWIKEDVALLELKKKEQNAMAVKHRKIKNAPQKKDNLETLQIEVMPK